ncbi:uncharacterized protein LOC118420313 isoform X3 [Branchiostoma floridae]|uniref:Uncharacterized protein LOC118420313 isoform X3 n=1 Tax=Branchiostoma floridae TaxID=7739 RepID=A0A9J7MY69_BRAFL|nr:uncharacterized protein LOC118420313 isoform X3 [Branchiostoma floridae]
MEFLQSVGDTQHLLLNLQVGKFRSLKLELRVLPANGRTSWFTCEHQHEVVNLLRGVIEAKLEALRVRGKTAEKATAQQDPDVITGATLRVACCFKKNEVKHTFLIDTRHLDYSSDTSSKEEDTPSLGGSYRSFGLEQVRLVACVCQYSSEHPQALPMDQLFQGLSQLPKTETTDISNYFSRAPEETTTSMSDGSEVPAAVEKSRINLHKMMKRGKLQKKISKRKAHQTHKDTASSSHISESDSVDQNVPDTTRDHVEAQIEGEACHDEVDKKPVDDIVKEKKVSDCPEDIPSVAVPANIQMIVREGTSEEITNAVAQSCQESNTFQDIQLSQVEDTLPGLGNVPKKKRGRPKKNKVAVPSVCEGGNGKMHKMRTNDNNSKDRVREDGHKDEAKEIDTMIPYKDLVDMANCMTDRGKSKQGMLETKNTGEYKNVLDNDLPLVEDSKQVEKKSSYFSKKSHQDLFVDTEDSKNVLDSDVFESHVEDSKGVEEKSSPIGARSHHSFLNTSYDARENKYLDTDADRSTKTFRGGGPSSLDDNNGHSSDLRTHFEDKSAESSGNNSLRTTISETRTKRKLDSPLSKQPSKLSKLSRRKGRNAVRKNCFDDYLSSEDNQDGPSSQENVVRNKDKKEKSFGKQACGPNPLPTPSSTGTEDYDSDHSGYSKTQNASKNSVAVNRNLGKLPSKHPSSQEEQKAKRTKTIKEKMQMLSELFDDDDEIELLSDTNKRSFSELDINSSKVSADSHEAIAHDIAVLSKSQQKQTTHKISSKTCPPHVDKLNMSPVVKVMDISQAEEFRRILSPVLEKTKESTSSQGSPSSKNEVQERRTQDNHFSKQRAASQVMRKRLGFRKQRPNVFDVDSAGDSATEPEDHHSIEKTRKFSSTVFDEDLESCSDVSDENAVSSQDIEAKKARHTSRTSQSHHKDSQREKASFDSFEQDANENDVDVNNEIPTQTSKRAVTTKKGGGRGKKSKVVLERDSKDKKAAKKSRKTVSRPSQEVGQGNKRQGKAKKSKVKDYPDDDPDIVDEEITIDMQNGNSTIEEAMDEQEDEMNEMFFDMDDPGAVDDWQTTEIEDSIKNIRHVKDLNSEQIRFLVQKDERYLKDIFKGKIFCRRHEDYKRGGSSRADLNFQVRLGMFHEDQQDEVLEVLSAMFCPAGNNKYLDYVFKVLLPEALIKIHMHISGGSHDESEDIMQQALSRRSLCASMSMSD